MRSIKCCVLLIILSVVFSFSVAFSGQDGLPDEFCYLDNILSDVVYDVRYFGSDNFVGESIDGYGAERIILTRDAATALAGAQKDLAPFGLGLKIFDGYRPQDAVLHFVRWAEDLNDIRMKQKYYPGVQKEDLFSGGYIAEKSSHSRGSTVDLTIIDLKTAL